MGNVRILVELTKQRLNIDLDQLSPDSSQPIYVQCVKCEEIFLRERCRVLLPHSCSRFDMNGRKKCQRCHNYYLLEEYVPWHGREIPYCILCWKELREYVVKTIAEIGVNEQLHQGLSDDLMETLLNQSVELFPKRDIDNKPALVMIDPDNGFKRDNFLWELPCRHERAPVRVECRLIHPDAKLPYRKRITDAGYDIFSIEPVTIPPHQMRNVRTGLIISCPNGYFYHVEGRSSMWMKMVTPFHGTIDATYCGELMIALSNESEKIYEVSKGDRIAQIIFHEMIHYDLTQVNEFGPDYNQRGANGFGSSGR